MVVRSDVKDAMSENVRVMNESMMRTNEKRGRGLTAEVQHYSSGSDTWRSVVAPLTQPLAPWMLAWWPDSPSYGGCQVADELLGLGSKSEPKVLDLPSTFAL
ncbi:hypothetical protein MRX96_013477 [Rhipicephalus microplus]